MQENSLNRIKKQFLANIPIQEISWNNAFVNMNAEHQQWLVNNTINYNLNVKYPLKVEYQNAFIKYIIDQLQKCNIEVEDCVYDAFGRILRLNTNNYCYKHYEVEKRDVVIKENVNIISEGTTGLCSWQASVALSQWALDNKDYLKEKIILELGSGVGLTGIILSQFCGPKHVFLSDCHTAVLKLLCENVDLNLATKGSYLEPNHTEYSANNGNKLSVLNLPWGEVNNAIVKTIVPDIIVAADIIYDRDLFEPLIKTIEFFINTCNTRAIFACTERNPDTLQEFLDLIKKKNFVVNEFDSPKQNNFVWSCKIPIRFFMINK